MRKLVTALGLGLITAATAGTAVAQRGGWAEPQCDLNKGHFLVNSAVLYLRNASTTRYPDQRERDLRDAKRVLTQAIDQGQEDNGSVWYLLGRFYEMTGDAAGLDSAYKRARVLAPQCRDDILTHVRATWAPVLNRGVDAVKRGDNEAAKRAFRHANVIFDGEPNGFYYLANVFASENQTDSALHYYRLAVRIASDSTNRSNASFQEIRETSTFNLARLYHREQAWDSAVTWYRRVRELNPNDPQALSGLAAIYSTKGDETAALALYDTVLARADSMSAIELFETGVAMFRADRFDRAAEAFEKGLERNPYFRDALYNLANTYVSLANQKQPGATPQQERDHKKAVGARMSPVARRLVAVDGHNRASLRLLAASYQLEGMPDSTLAVLERAQQLSFEITVLKFQPSRTGAELAATIVNNKAEPTDLPAVTFELLDAQGAVVVSDVVPAGQLAADEVKEVRAAPTGERIVAWRYRVGG